jgi:hypothetical protein
VCLKSPTLVGVLAPLLPRLANTTNTEQLPEVSIIISSRITKSLIIENN